MNNLLKPILASFIFGLLLWLVDSVLDYYFFYDNDFLDLVLLDIPSHEVYIRSLIILSFLIFGLINGLSKVKLNKSLANLKQANYKLDKSNQKIIAREKQLKENYLKLIEHEKHISKNSLEIQERVKELQGLYNIVESISRNTKIDTLITEIIEIIPTSWQYSDITIARIIYKDQIYSSQGFIETQWLQRTPLIVDNIKQGEVEVFYTKERKIHDEGPFLLEERRLIDTISKTLGKAIERIHYFEKLEIQEKQYEALFNGINDIIHVSDPDTYEVIFANSISKEKYGNDMIGKKCYQVYQNKTSPCDYCNNDKIFGKNIGNVHTWDVHNDQSKVWLRCTNKSILWPDGRLLRFELATDITYQRQLNVDLETANEQLITNEIKLKEAITKLTQEEKLQTGLRQRLELATDSAGIGVWELDLKNNILIWDDWMYNLYGVSKEDFVGAYETWQQGVHPDDLERSSKEVEEAIQGLKGFDTEFRIITPKGIIKHIKATAIISKNDIGESISMIGVNYDISDIRKNELQLQINEEKYKRAEIIAHVGSWEFDIKTNIFWGSDESKRIYGFDLEKENIEFEDFNECVPQIKEIRQALMDLIEHEKPYNLEFNVITKDTKKHKFIRSTAILEKDDDGNPIKVLGVIHDISKRKKAEANKIESEERFQLAMTASHDGIWDWDLTNNSVYYSPGWKKILGLKDLEQSLSSWVDRQHPEEKESVKVSIQNHLRGKTKTWEKEHRLKMNDGLYKWVLGKGQIVKRDKNGKALRMMGTMRDIQKRKKDEIMLINAIKKSEENETRFKALHNASFGGITIHNKGVILDCNMGLSEISGYSQEELIGMDGILLIEEGSRGVVMKNILEKYEIPYESKGLRKNGEIYPLRLEAREIPYQGKKARVVEFRDITNQKKTELELIEAKKKAEESDQLKSSFLANMSHEIRTPMNGILGFTSLLEEPDLTGEEQHTYIEIIKKSGLRMLDTVNDIINISKIDSGQMEVNIGLVNVCEEIHSLYEFFKPEAKKKGLELTMKNNLCLDKVIPILTDNPKFNSILTNLIKNAIKYTDKGSIIIQVDKIENNLFCSVTDTGIGIPENKLRGIFNRFEQVDMKDTRAYDGSGLGLAITQSYIEMLNGTIHVESESQKGSCFSFTLPWKVKA